jgi:threonine dehydratase
MWVTHSSKPRREDALTISVPTLEDVQAAARRIAPHVRRTPVLESRTIDRLVGADVAFKCEHLQGAGAFKLRGATNAVWSLDDDTAARGVAAHSSGNHAAALAMAARVRGVPSYVVMPSNAPRVKLEAARRYGAQVFLCDPSLEARADTLEGVLERTGAVEIHPYDDPRVIAGQGTATLELLEDRPGLTMVVAPVSGGGLLSGTAIVAHGCNPEIAIVGAEPSNVDDAARSLAAGELVTGENGSSIADGLLATLSARTFTILADHDTEIVTVSEDEIVDAMRLIFEVLKQVVEPSGATALAAVLRARSTLADADHRVGVILSGGNVDCSHVA